MRTLSLFFALTFLLLSGALHSEFIFSGREARLRVSDPSAQFIVNTQMTGFAGTLQRGELAAAQIQGKSSILFDGGVIEANKFRALFSGVFDPLNDDVVRLTGNHLLSVNAGIVATPIVVSGAENTIQGAPLFGAPIILSDTTSAVTLSLIAPLNQPVVLNGGTLSLGLDLDLVQAGGIDGTGVIDGRNFVVRLSENVTTWTEALVFKNVGQLQLRGTTSLSSVWTFSSSAGTSVIDGLDNVLDLSFNGRLVIPPGQELVCINTTLRGIGNERGRIVFGDAASQLTLIGCTLELSSNYSFSSGLIHCRGESSVVLAGANVLAFDGDSMLTLDGVQLVYDVLSTLNVGGVVADLEHVALRNGGRIVARVQDENGPSMLFTHESNVLLKSESLSSNRSMSFNVPGVNAVSLDGCGFTLRLPQVKKHVIYVADGQTVVLQNMILDGFCPEHVSLGVGSKLVFGDNAFVCLGSDSVLSYPIVFDGNAVFCGSGNVLTLSKTGALVSGSGKTLNLVDIVIKGLATSAGQLVFQDHASTISCVDVVLHFDSNYVFTVGTMHFNGAPSTMITGANIVSFKNQGSLVVDGVSLFYDTLASPDLHNIQPWIADGALFVSLNGGRICPVSSIEKEGDVLLDLRINYLIQAESLSSTRRFIFRGQRAFGSALTLDGAGFVVQMPRSRSGVIIVPDGKSVTLQNIVLRDFAPEHICLGVGASLVFGDGVLLQLSDDCILTGELNFAGKAMIDGRYKRLDFGGRAEAVITVASGGALKIVNTNLTGLSGFCLAGSSSDAHIQLYSSTLQLSSDACFSTGCLDIYNDVYVSGLGNEFSFASAGTLTIHRGAQLCIDSGVTFKYDSPGATGLVFDDATARIFLQNATFASGRAGLFLSKGTVVIGGMSFFEAKASGVMSIATDMDVNVQNGATLEVAGTVIYG